MDPNSATPDYTPPTVGITIIISGDPPPFPAAPRSVDFGPLKLILGILALITIPILIYTLFFCSPCFSNSGHRRRRRSSGDNPDNVPETDIETSSTTLSPSASEDGGAETPPAAPAFGAGEKCAVCLSKLGNGDEVRELSACNHAFHAACVDKWLSSKSICPICRATAAPPRRFVETIGNNYRFNYSDYASDMV